MRLDTSTLPPESVLTSGSCAASVSISSAGGVSEFELSSFLAVKSSYIAWLAVKRAWPNNDPNSSVARSGGKASSNQPNDRVLVAADL